MRLMGVLVVVAFVLAGCAGKPSPSANNTEIPFQFHDVEFHWATSDFTGPTVVAIDFRVPPETRCQGRTWMHSAAPQQGPTAITLLLRDGQVSGRAGGWRSESPSVHAFGTDTRPTGSAPAGGGGGGFGGGSGEDQSVLTYMLIAPDVQPDTQGESLALDFACDAPFDVVGARAGSDVFLANLESLRGGTGASTGDLVISNADGGGLTAQSPQVLAGYLGLGAVGRLDVTLTHPGGTATYTTSQSNLVHGGPGDYVFQATGALALGGSELFLVTGFSDGYDVQPGLRETSAIER